MSSCNRLGAARCAAGSSGNETGQTHKLCRGKGGSLVTGNANGQTEEFLWASRPAASTAAGGRGAPPWHAAPACHTAQLSS